MAIPSEQAVETPEVEQAMAELRRLTEAIGVSKGSLDALYNERREVFRTLLAAGIKQATIARMAGVTSMAVAFAVERTPH